MAVAPDKNNPPNPVLGGKEGSRRVFKRLGPRNPQIMLEGNTLQNRFIMPPRKLMAFPSHTPIHRGYSPVRFCDTQKDMLVFITDLDGTLLDETYSYEAAEPALRSLSRLRIPLVLCTSKTRAEVEVCRSRLGNRHPFIVENGGALYIPERYFDRSINAPVHRDGYAVIEFGDPYPELVRCLLQASMESNCIVRGFHQMSVEAVSARCNMSVAAASLAKKREYDEPFEILGGEGERLTEAIEMQKKRWTRGGSFYHILGSNDKAHCVNLLLHFYKRIFTNIVSVGLGDGLNDAGFLNLVDIPILLESPAIEDLQKAVPRGWQSSAPGPQGWNAAVLGIIERHLLAEGNAIGMEEGLPESASTKAFLM